MFQNAYQCGTHLEIFDPKETISKSNKQKQKEYYQLHKINIPHNVTTPFDKDLKGYIYEMQGHVTKLQLPRSGDLGLVQQYLVLQIYLYVGAQWTMELVVTDIQKTKRRIILTSAVRGLESKFFHIKSPNDQIRRGVWLNLQIDVWSFMEGWKDCTFRTLDMIVIGAPCKLRKVYITKNPIEDSELVDLDIKLGFQQIPKKVNFPDGFMHNNQVISFKLLNYDFLEDQQVPIKRKQSIPMQRMVPSSRRPLNVKSKPRLDQIYRHDDNDDYQDDYEDDDDRQQLDEGRLESTEQLLYMEELQSQGKYKSNAPEHTWSEIEKGNSSQIEFKDLHQKQEQEYYEDEEQGEEQYQQEEEEEQGEEEYQLEEQQQLDDQHDDDVSQEEYLVEEKKQLQGTQSDLQTDEYIQVVYDPVLQCFYDPRTNQYYQLKE